MPRPPFSPELDAEMVASLKIAAKRQLRARMRALRQALPAPSVALRSRRIVDRIIELPAYVSARAIALYAPMAGRGEVDVRELEADARRRSKRVFYPFVHVDPPDPPRTGFKIVEAAEDLAERGRAFLEPPPTATEATASELDLIIVPALAADPNGNRLGQGSGFYDETLPRYRPPALAVAVVYDFQLLAELPVEPHDVRCDLVITDSAVDQSVIT